MTNNEKAHRLAYRYLCDLSAGLERGTVHLRDKTGRLLQTLDEVVLAAREGRWPTVEESVSLNGGVTK